MERKYDKILADTAERRRNEHAEASERLSNKEPVTRDEFRQIQRRIDRKIEEIEYRHLTRQRDDFRQLANTYDNRLQKQIRLGRILSSCSPYAVLTSIAMTLANTSGGSQMAFLKKARQYEDDYFREMHTRGEVIYFYYHVDDLPSFSSKASSLPERMRQSLPGIGLLVAFGILCFMAGYLLFLRCPV
jgi:hypothetical protein